ncbi:MAG: penicillin-binding transpeptidase domain-containing protein [Chlamydiales bacterium]
MDLPRALEASSNPYFSMLAGDVIEDPEDLLHASNLLGFGEKTAVNLPGEYAGSLPEDIIYNRTGLYSMAIGQHSLVGTPLQTAVMLSAIANGGNVLRPKIAMDEDVEVRWQIFLPEEIRKPLIQGMKQVMVGEKGTARSARSQFPAELFQRVVGKTSTAETYERFSLDGTTGQMKDKVIWFGGILFSKEDKGSYKKPEIVVVVYLRYGLFGRLAVPFALKMAQKWEEINEMASNLHEGVW